MRFLILCFFLSGGLFAQVDPFLLIGHFIDLDNNEDMVVYLVNGGYTLSDNATDNTIELSKGRTIISFNSKKCNQISISSDDDFFKQAIKFEWQNRNDQSSRVDIENLSRLQWTDPIGRQYLVVLDHLGKI